MEGTKEMRLPQETQVEDIVVGKHRRAHLAVAIPTLGMVPIEFVTGFARMQMPVNGVAESYMVKGMEVGEARNYVVEQVLKKPVEKQPRYIFFLGDDMIPPWDGLLKLHTEAEEKGWDVLAGLYYWKGEPPMPLLWRDDHVGRLEAGNHYQVGDVVWCDVTGMDFTLLRTAKLRELEPPYFKTGPGKAKEFDSKAPLDTIVTYTEDVYFCKKMKEASGNIGVHTGVRVAHIKVATGEIY